MKNPNGAIIFYCCENDDSKKWPDALEVAWEIATSSALICFNESSQELFPIISILNQSKYLWVGLILKYIFIYCTEI